MSRYRTDFSVKICDLDSRPVRLEVSSQALSAAHICGEAMTDEQRKVVGLQLDKLFQEELTLGRACSDALTCPYPDEKVLGEQEARRRHGLAKRVHKGGMQEFNAEERVLMKLVLGKRYPGALVAPEARLMLDEAEAVRELAAVT